MTVEARRAASNEQAQLARGGVEPRGDVYAWMRVAYPLAFALMLIEGVWRGVPPVSAQVTGAVLFAAGKLLKWWAIVTLGPFWTFRVIVVPGTWLVGSGPYRWLRHPNYVGVAGELAGVAFMTGSVWAGPLGLTVFGALLARRIAVESRALEAASRRRPASK